MKLFVRLKRTSLLPKTFYDPHTEDMYYKLFTAVMGSNSTPHLGKLWCCLQILD
jgi:hypothetical protein